MSEEECLGCSHWSESRQFCKMLKGDYAYIECQGDYYKSREVMTDAEFMEPYSDDQYYDTEEKE